MDNCKEKKGVGALEPGKTYQMDVADVLFGDNSTKGSDDLVEEAQEAQQWEQGMVQDGMAEEDKQSMSPDMKSGDMKKE